MLERFASRFYAHRNNVNQNWAAGPMAPIQWTTALFDALNELHLGVGEYYFQPREAGYYYIKASARRANFVLANTIDQLEIRVTPNVFFLVNYKWIAVNFNDEQQASGVLYLTPNDRVHVWWHTTAGAPNDILDGNIYATYFCGHKLS